MISIIVPVYNVKAYLENCLMSIKAQTYTDFEVILVDDGSTDHSGAVCDAWAAVDPRFRVLHTENKGAGHARNTGLAAARGEYIMFVDSDDTIHPHMAEHLFRALQAQPQAGYVMCDIFWTGSTPQGNWDASTGRPPQTFSGKEMWHHYYSTETVLFDVVWNKLYRASLWQDIRFPVGRTVEDTAIAYLLLEKAGCVVMLWERLYAYLQREKSVSHVLDARHLQNILLALDERQTFIREKHPDLLTKDTRKYLEVLDTQAKSDIQDAAVRTKLRRLRRKFFWKDLPSHPPRERLRLLAANRVPRVYALYKKLRSR